MADGRPTEETTTSSNANAWATKNVSRKSKKAKTAVQSKERAPPSESVGPRGITRKRRRSEDDEADSSAPPLPAENPKKKMRKANYTSEEVGSSSALPPQSKKSGKVAGKNTSKSATPLKSRNPVEMAGRNDSGSKKVASKPAASSKPKTPGGAVEEDAVYGPETGWKIKPILEHKKRKGRYWYKVEWEGYWPDEPTSWRPSEDVEKSARDDYWESKRKRR